ncbi:hypothetical protein E2562_013746 [Oryza meyeriana var. granulata]|uniref:Cyclase n=1 Tax=Oryza meyeriana var. granulata TaxID=110450 RepID=A0A6G1BLK3_9ORYZ|nr:hypothetical protein E2562_013746 [Oryza meyeriana var. granulata]
MAAAHLALLLLLAVVARHALPAAGSDAHPGYDGTEDTCGGPAAAGRMEEYGGGRILDITHVYRPDLPAFASGAATGPVVRLKDSMANGSLYNLSKLEMECHMGTHVDAPGHMNQGHFAAGLDVDKLDLELLNGMPSPPRYLFPSSASCLLSRTGAFSRPSWVASGDGLAFFLSPFPSVLPNNSAGGLLGLFNSSAPGLGGTHTSSSPSNSTPTRTRRPEGARALAYDGEAKNLTVALSYGDATPTDALLNIGDDIDMFSESPSETSVLPEVS